MTGQYSGLAIELLEDIAKDLNLQSNYRLIKTFRSLSRCHSKRVILNIAQ